MEMEIKMKKLGSGTMGLPVLNQGDPASVDLEQICKMVGIFMERGFAYFDTAYMYHKYESERAVKEALVDRWPRDGYVLADKLPLSHLKEGADMERSFQEQLEKCGVSYPDYYMLHNMSRSYYETAERLGTFAFVRRKKEGGEVRRIGFSFHADTELLEGILLKHPELDSVQLQLDCMDWGSPSIQSRQCYEVCHRYGKDAIVTELVKGGTLTDVSLEAEESIKTHVPGMTPAPWTVRLAVSRKGVIMVLSGMSDYGQLLDNTVYTQDFVPLTEEEEGIVARVAEIIQLATAIVCTSCQYCVEGCPKQIPIPKYFSPYNQHSLFGEKSNSRGYHQSYGDRYGKAGDCIGCRRREAICPQHSPIVQHMKEMAEVFESAK